MAMGMNENFCYYISQGEISLCQQIYKQYPMLCPDSTCSQVFIYLSKFLSFRFYLSLFSIFRGILSKRFRDKTVTIKVIKVFKSMGVHTISNVTVSPLIRYPVYT